MSSLLTYSNMVRLADLTSLLKISWKRLNFTRANSPAVPLQVISSQNTNFSGEKVKLQ